MVALNGSVPDKGKAVAGFWLSPADDLTVVIIKRRCLIEFGSYAQREEELHHVQATGK